MLTTEFHNPQFQKEDTTMQSGYCFALIVTSLMVTLGTGTSWSQPPNPTASDANRNTAGGTDALLNVTPGAAGGFDSTAFGYWALRANTIGSRNTAERKSVV